MKIPKGSIDNEHRVPDTPNGSEKVAQPKPKAKSHRRNVRPNHRSGLWEFSRAKRKSV